MKYSDFKKILNSNNINIYDAQSRIVHWKINNLLNNNNQNNNQNGGNIDIQDFIINKFKNKKNLFNIFINSLITNDTNRINYIINII